MTDDDNDDVTYAPVMPFVAVTSAGGPYEDVAYVAGYELGVLEGQLSGARTPTPEKPGPPAPDEWRWIHKANADQADLIAMKHNRSIEFGETFEDLVAIRVLRGDR